LEYICDQPGLLAGLFVACSFVALQLPFSPMRVFARLIESPLDMLIERSQHADARVHQKIAAFGGACRRV
jgi:hypothetical protein